MKTISRIFIATLLMVTSYVSNAQGINFQGVSRSANGTILASSNISLRLSIISKSVDATPEYVEIKKVVTNAQGIFSIVIGDAVVGSTTGTFSSINWANAPKFLKVEMDPSGGTSYISMGITQLQYVPYSFYSLGVAAENVTGVLPVEKGGTGVGSLDDLKTALKITTFSSDITVNGLTVGLGGGQSSNTGLGKGALKSNTTGAGNTAIGSSTLSLNTTGNGSTALGNNALAKSTGSSNTSIGSDNMPVNTTGSYNTSVGAYSFYTNTTGSNNIGMGRGHLYNNTTGNSNIAIGNDALQNNISADNNIAIGGAALNKNTTGYNNIGIGVDALYANTTGAENIALGRDVLKANTTGSPNLGIGTSSLSSNTTGYNNIGVGMQTLASNTTGAENIAIGRTALTLNTTGGPNIAIGTNALSSNTTGSNNIGVGMQTLAVNTTGGGNIALGRTALTSNTTGANNTAVGYQASSSNTTGYNNTAVGQGSLLSTTEGPNNVAVGVSALKNNVIGSRNVAIGVGAMEANLGSVNNAFGYLALNKNTTASENNAFGHQALEQNTTGTGNAGFGHNVMQANLIGNLNTAMGYAALKANLTNDNSSFGARSLQDNTTGTENAAFGEEALTVNTTGSYVAAFGAEAGKANTTGSYNTYLGANANTSTGTISNSTAIGYNAQVTASNQIQLGNANVTMVKSAGVLSSSRGLLPPKFSAVERDAIVDPEQGLTIYCYNCGTYGELQVFNGNGWINASGSATAAAITDVTAGLVASFPLDGTAAGTNTSTSTQISTVTKAMTTAWTYTLPATDPNKTYKMVVSGTWGIANGRAHRDAAYDANSNNTIGSTGTPVANRGCDANWVFEGNCAPPAPTSPSGYASNNTYEYYLGNGKSGGYSLAFTDGSYGDNVGSLTFTLYEVGIAGSTTGTVTYTTNRKGTANSAMQGGAGYITAPSSIFQFTRTQAFTVSVWFTADAVTTSGRLLSTESPEGNFRIAKSGSNNMIVSYGDYVYQTVSNNDWHHLVYTYNNRLEKVYMDGVLVQTNTDTSTEALSYGAPFTIGAKAASAFDMWAGKIDDVKVYNRALLPNEVLVLFNQ